MPKNKPINQEELVKHIDELLSWLHDKRAELGIEKDEPLEANVCINKDEVSIFKYAPYWEGVANLITVPIQIATLSWKEIPAATLLKTIDTLFKGAVKKRHKGYRVCKVCGKNTPEEYRDGNECFSCMGKRGVVF